VSLEPGTLVFVTGGSGFLGRALIREFVARGCKVRALARSDAAREAVRLAGAQPIAGGLHSQEALERGCDGVAVVFHCAAIADDWGTREQFDQVNVVGTRNVLAMEWNPWANKLYFVMHGRDSLGMLWKDFYSREDNAELPAEEFHVAAAGDNFGWPYTYYDHLRGERMQAPEYGGDGKMEAEGNYKEPLIGFPGHWAPMDLIFHSGKNLPEKYAQGAFIIFHGSWNRMPLEQKGYKVVFVPMRDGEVTGDWEVFADGFKGVEKLMNPGNTAYRPVGLAEGPNGEIYIGEDKHGRIWRVTWSGNP